jgi:hypothetical protein
MKDELSYTSLVSDDLSDADTLDKRKSSLWRQGKKSPVWFWVSGSLLLSMLMLSTFILLNCHRASAGTAIYSCGRSPSEARAKSCQFEPMMSAWIPTQCSHPSLISEYPDIFSTWSWFYDFNLTSPITALSELEELRAGNYSKVWTSRKHAHDLHCLYAWRKTSIALDGEEGKQGLLDKRSFDFYHSTHCAKHISKLLEGEDPLEGKLYATAWPMMYHDCVSIGGR